MAEPAIDFNDPAEVKKFVASASLGLVGLTVRNIPLDTPLGWLAVGQCFEGPNRFIYIRIHIPDGLVPDELVSKVPCLNAKDWTVVYMDPDTNTRPVLHAELIAQIYEDTP